MRALIPHLSGRDYEKGKSLGMSHQGSTVAIRKCESYEYDLVAEALRSALEPLGGIKAVVKKGDRVLLKVNLLAAKSPEKAITTHPLVLEAVAREVAAAGGKVIVGDSPAGVLKNIKRYWKNTGIGEAVERTGGELVKLEGAGTRAHRVDDRLYHLTSVLENIDVVINLPKLKTHGLTLFTGAVKNCFGLIPGFQKSEFHKIAPKVEPFSRIIVDIFSIVRPSLHIMDGILGLQGNGPSTSGSPRRIGLLLASHDAVALDAVASRIIGLKEDAVATTRIAAERGLGEDKIENIGLDSQPLGEIAIDDYDLPSNYYLNFVPTWLIKLLGQYVWVRPKAKPLQCTGCGICISNCPVNAMAPNHEKIPDIDYSLCINCLSCDESCPEGAIEQKVSWLAKKLT